MNGIAAMLRDIDFEVEVTAAETGRSSLAQRVRDAMATVPRESFVPDFVRPSAFANGPLPIGHGQTISQPFIVALMTDLLEPQPEHRILEIGTGSGYQTAVLAELVKEVFSIEIIEALATDATRRLKHHGYKNIVVKHADGYLGWPEHGPYDGIIVTAAAPHVPPPLVEQLKAGGRLVIPVGMSGWPQDLRIIEKTEDGSIRSRGILSVAFVPLTRAGVD